MFNLRTSGLIFLVFFSTEFAMFAQPADMAIIPPGIYTPLYKSGYEKSISLKSFLLDIHAVTNQEYFYFTRTSENWQKSRVKAIFAEENYLHHWLEDKKTKKYKFIENSPVTNISWFAARSYCRSLGKRLPTVHEWEYAASYNKKNSDPIDINTEILNWYGKPTPDLIPHIYSTWSNTLGVWDMHGLIWEWVEDFNSVFVTGESRADSQLDRNLFCGGASAAASDFFNYAAFMRYAFRSSLQARYTVGNLGFRCAKDLE